MVLKRRCGHQYDSKWSSWDGDQCFQNCRRGLFTIVAVVKDYVATKSLPEGYEIKLWGDISTDVQDRVNFGIQQFYGLLLQRRSQRRLGPTTEDYQGRFWRDPGILELSNFFHVKDACEFLTVFDLYTYPSNIIYFRGYTRYWYHKESQVKPLRVLGTRW